MRRRVDTHIVKARRQSAMPPDAGDAGGVMPNTSVHHHHPWLSARWLVVITIALMFALCATPV
jgi:hypothetical protein